MRRTAAAFVTALVFALPATTPSPASAHERLLYVASADSGPVTAYDVSSSGVVSPERRVPNPNNPNTFWDPWTVAFDRAGNLYVQTFLSDATSFVFRPEGQRPSRIFMVSGPDNSGIVVDSSGYEYVIGGEGSPVIYVAAPGASGKPSSLYSVPALRTIYTGNTNFNPWASVLTLGPANEIVAALSVQNGNAIAVYAGGPKGKSTPLRVIEGPHTGLVTCGNFNCGVSIAYSALTGRIYAAVSGPGGVHLSEFAAGASGDATPLATIQGPHTGFTGMVAPGLAVDPITGDIYVMVKKAQFFAPGRVEVFAAKSSGDARPIREFTDSSTRFTNAQGLALSPTG
jgi:hypothetical protein